MSNYQKLKVWQIAMDLVVEIYRLTKDFPKEEKFGLVAQMRRSSVSIPSNIAEGSGRNSKGLFSNFLKFAHGSTCELETQLIISQRLKFLSDSKVKELTQQTTIIQKMLHKLIQSLNDK
jgi:four helix bundle protein